jgi:hypothetical protein
MTRFDRPCRSRRGQARLVLAGPALAVAAAVACEPVAAQELEPGQTIRDRPRPNYDPRGLRVGGFLVFPSLTLREAYDSNIFATPDDEEGDFITRISPEVAAESQWSNHQLNFRAGAEQGVYADNSDENYLDWNIGVDGRLDITRDSNLFAGASWNNEHEERGSPDDVNGEEPTEFDVANLTFGGEHTFNRLSFRLTNTYDRFDYDDVGTAGGGVIDNDDRDREIYATTLRASYEIQRNFAAFVEGSYNIREYDASQTDSRGTTDPVNRDSDGWGIALGSAFDLTGITFGEASIGYRQQTFDDPQLDDVTGIAANASLTSNVTQLTSVTLAVQTSVDETTVGEDNEAAAASFSRGANLRVDHELLRNLLLNAEVGFVNRDFEGVDRMDNTVSAGLGADYLMNRYLNFGVGYDFETRQSDQSGADYDKHLFFLSGTLQF